MTEHSSFFNSVTGDRAYKAEDFAKYFSSFISNGIFPNPSTNLQVMANGDMTVTVKAGLAWINGYFYYLDADTIFTIETADGTLNRIDRVIVHLDTAGRIINAKILKGTIASSPVVPTIEHDADGYDLVLADVAINAGATSISQSNITDQRQNSDLCGIVNSLITVDSATLFNQFTDGFNTWFAGIKNTLGSDVAGSLLNKINDLAGDGRTTETVKGNADNITSLNNTVTSHLSDYTKGYAVTTGTSTAYVATLTPAPTIYEDGMQITILPHVDCGATPTLNIDELGALTIVKQDGSAISAGDIKANNPLSLVRVGSNFFIRSSSSKYDINKNITADNLSVVSYATDVLTTYSTSISNPSDVLIDSNENRYVISYGTIARINTDGTTKWTKSFNVNTGKSTMYNDRLFICVGSGGDTYIYELNIDDGSTIWSKILSSMSLYGFIVGSDGYLYFTTWEGTTLLYLNKYDLSGNMIKHVFFSSSQPSNIVFYHDSGYLYMNFSGNYIYKFETTNLTTVISGNFGGSKLIAYSPITIKNGYLYFANGNNIYKCSLTSFSGVISTTSFANAGSIGTLINYKNGFVMANYSTNTYESYITILDENLKVLATKWGSSIRTGVSPNNIIYNVASNYLYKLYSVTTYKIVS